MSFFEILAHPGAKTLDFGTPLAPNWAPNDAQNHPSGVQTAPISQRWWCLFRNLEPTCFQDHFWSALGHHFRRFRMILGSILMDLGIIFDGCWLLLRSSICRMPKPPGTKRNNGKRQEHADNCRNMQTLNASKKRRRQ